MAADATTDDFVSSFVDHYFRKLDSNRLLINEYGDDSELICQGRKHSGAQNIISALLALPSHDITHSITSIDYRLIDEEGCLVYVCGTQHYSCVYGALHFTQMFQLKRQERGRIYVYRATFRVDPQGGAQGVGGVDMDPNMVLASRNFIDKYYLDFAINPAELVPLYGNAAAADDDDDDDADADAAAAAVAVAADDDANKGDNEPELIFQGNRFHGKDRIERKLTSLHALKQCQHTITAFDCIESEIIDGILVSVHGRLQFPGVPSTLLRFTQMFLLKAKETDNLYVDSDIFRLIYA